MSGLFDPDFYHKRYPETITEVDNPILHFMLKGWHEDKNPSSIFDTHYYLTKYYDVRQLKTNPLLHFIKFGIYENRLPKQTLNPQEKQQIEKIKQSFLMQLFHLAFNKPSNVSSTNQSQKEWHQKRKHFQKIFSENKHEPGVNIIGYLGTAKGIAEAARSSILAMKTANIPYSIIDHTYGIPIGQRTESIHEHEKIKGFRYNTNLFHINPPEMPHLWESHNQNALSDRFNIGVWYWELPEFPDEWRFAFNLVDEVWVATEFVKKSISSKSPVPVIKIPPCIQIYQLLPAQRKQFNLPDDQFLYLCAFDSLSTHARKNPWGAIKAFQQAFSNSDKNVGLIIKVANSQENPEELDRLKGHLAGYANIYYISETLDRPSMNNLINSADVYISLHRSEGFGLIPAEAMYLGKPVIMTRWSGNLDLMTMDNACGVNYELIPVQEQHGPYKPGQIWAEPDIDHASYFMKKLYKDKEYYDQIGSKAQQFIKQEFSPEKIGLLIKNRLTYLGLI